MYFKVPRVIANLLDNRAETIRSEIDEAHKLLEEAKTLATAVEYDCEQGDHSFFGFPAESNYRSYQPYKALIR